MLEFNEELVLLDLIAPDSESVIRSLADKLYGQRLVSSDYGQKTFERELNHPTGLPTTPFFIAFPHADADGVRISSLAIATLRNPVVFKNMADPEEDLPVDLVLMLANNSPEEQVQTLRSLALIFGESEKLVALRSLSTPEEVVAWFRLELSLD